ncbi:MAG: hypothetical protein HS111_32480 [Kofleriaceae bacterium]|nr:hypothetical protein [Kofleriaceae bacterium]MCL4226437.1 hypothetical protein [Myxococcales bacterium]
MRTVVLASVVSLVALGCKGKEQKPAAAPPPADAAVKKDTSTGALPPPRTLVPMGEPFSAREDGSAGQPALAVTADGAALVAWVEGGGVHLRRWSGAGWDEVAPSPDQATNRADGEPSLAVEPDGAVLVGWLERAKPEHDTLQVARWKDGAWSPLGAPASAPVSGAAVAASALGPVAVWVEAQTVQVRVHRDGAWAPLGDGTLRATPDGLVGVAPALATAGDHVVVGWIERTPAIVTSLRRWDAAAGAWVAVPPPEGADGKSHLAVAVVPDGTITVALTYTVGLRQVVTRAPGDVDWKIIDVPELANGYVDRTRLAGVPDGRVLFSYPFGGRFAWWDGATWIATPVGVMAPSQVVPAAAGGAGGVVVVAWSAGPPGKPERVRVLEVKK